MLKYTNHDIVFQEFPDEVTLAINLSLCPNRCPGCHSAWLQDDVGQELDAATLRSLTAHYAGAITCVALMGGDNDPATVAALLLAIRQEHGGRLRTGWYSGREALPEGFVPEAFDYVKLGPWREVCGPLSHPHTNQRLYRIDHTTGRMLDITARMQRRMP